jgi:hypothetical protein
VKTIIHVTLTDEERNLIGRYLHRNSVTKYLATRNDVKDLVAEFISDTLKRAHTGEYDDDADDNTEAEPVRHRGDSVDGRPADDQGLPDVSDAGNGFKPSRGDEPYLYKPKSVALKDACSAMLDQAETIEQLVWDVLEANREK